MTSRRSRRHRGDPFDDTTDDALRAVMTTGPDGATEPRGSTWGLEGLRLRIGSGDCWCLAMEKKSPGRGRIVLVASEFRPLSPWSPSRYESNDAATGDLIAVRFAYGTVTVTRNHAEVLKSDVPDAPTSIPAIPLEPARPLPSTSSSKAKSSRRRSAGPTSSRLARRAPPALKPPTSPRATLCSSATRDGR